ncbi:DUF998 domain-containing protein [Rufibacter roseus]|uniref:DUF998 domain-containing protein n=1 Tax=Rufibacter roseus TaxID=1567108 RepID=A0ABW2DPI8_9BACT|nr:DUF998 domain-containing protein [Rufibacter roseus]
METTALFAYSTLALGILSILCLVSLHVVSREFKPSFRMVSEYALGNHKGLLTLFFLCWGFCSISAGMMLWPEVTRGWATVGVVLLFVTGVGAIMGGLFDVKHKLHGPAFGVGLPFMPIGALLLSYHLIQIPEWQEHSFALLFSAHAIWVSLVLMGVSMFLLFSSLKSAGIVFGPDAPPLAELPKGVIGVNGWANRLLVLCYLLYPVLLAKLFLTIQSS